jgi:predicted glycosyltransferase
MCCQELQHGLHQKFIKKFNECWVPDFKNEPNFSGELGHLEREKSKIKYIGILSRFKRTKLAIKYDLLVVLSGPEPQRTLLEDVLYKELTYFKGEVLFVRGLVSSEEYMSPTSKNIRLVNYMLSNELEQAFNESNVVLARSGYSTIMDLAALGKKAFFIPTPGQTEQEYLAKKFQRSLVAPQISQHNFTIDKLIDLEYYTGFEFSKNKVDPKLFELFNCK